MKRLITVLLFVLMVGYGVSLLFAGTVYRPVNLGENQYDSVRVEARYGSTVEYDSLYTAFPVDDSLALDDRYNWSFQWIYWYNNVSDSSFEVGSDFWPLASQGGSGHNEYIVYFEDTSNTAAVTGVKWSIRDASGNEQIPKWTDADSCDTVWINDGAYTLYGTASGFYFDPYTITLVSDSLDTLMCYEQTLPAAAVGASVVTAYIDIGSGQVDSVSGAWIPRARSELTLRILGAASFKDSNLVIIPEDWIKRPDNAGRVTFEIPVNSHLIPDYSYYELTYRTFDNQSRRSGLIRRFRVDTTDPINILNTTEVR